LLNGKDPAQSFRQGTPPGRRKELKMSTRSTIGLLQPDGSVKAIFVQYNGHPERQGEILKSSYKSRSDVEKLLALGDLLYVGRELGEKQDINNPLPDTCVAFARDGQEKINPAVTFENLEKLLINYSGCDYAYLFDGKEWETYRPVLTTRFLKPGVEILYYWQDFYDIRVTSIYDFLGGQKNLEVARQVADQQ